MLHQSLLSTRKRGAACRRTFGAVTLTIVVAFAISGCGKPNTTATDPEPKTKASAAPTATPMADVVGHVIAFSSGGDSEPYRVAGWGDTEKDFTWSIGKSARLKLPIGQNATALSLRMTLRGLIDPPKIQSQPVEVIVNGEKLADWAVGARADFQAAIPANIVAAGHGTLMVEMKTPNAMTPVSVGQGADVRVLGICCTELEVTVAK